MPIIPWSCAHGDALPGKLTCADTVELATPDSNTVIIAGHGAIHSFGPAPNSVLVEGGVPCTKLVIFNPREGEIILHHGPMMTLLCGRARVIRAPCVASYSVDSAGLWSENLFSETGDRETSHRLDRLEERIQKLETRGTPFPPTK